MLFAIPQRCSLQDFVCVASIWIGTQCTHYLRLKTDAKETVKRTNTLVLFRRNIFRFSR